MNAHPTSTEMGWGRGGVHPFPRPHPQKQILAVYTKLWTHLGLDFYDLLIEALIEGF